MKGLVDGLHPDSWVCLLGWTEVLSYAAVSMQCCRGRRTRGSRLEFGTLGSALVEDLVIIYFYRFTRQVSKRYLGSADKKHEVCLVSFQQMTHY